MTISERIDEIRGYALNLSKYSNELGTKLDVLENEINSKLRDATEEDKEIKVGDYVQFYSAFKHTTMIVTHINDDMRYCDGITFDGNTFTVNKDALHKTGKHYDILSVLDKLKESD